MVKNLCVFDLLYTFCIRILMAVVLSPQSNKVPGWTWLLFCMEFAFYPHSRVVFFRVPAVRLICNLGKLPVDMSVCEWLRASAMGW